MVHFHNIFPLISISGIVAAKLSGVKTLITLHNYRFWCIGSSFSRSGKELCLDCVNKFVPISGIKNRCFRNSTKMSLAVQCVIQTYRFFMPLRWVDQVQALSPHQKTILKKLEPKLKDPALLGHHLPKMNKVERGAFLIADIHLLFVGRVTEEKGFHNILEISDQIPANITIDVIGSYDGRFGDLASYGPRIRYHGALSEKAVETYMLKSDYLLNTSVVFETFGLTNIESFRCGLPIIAQNIGTRSDFIQNFYNGILYEKGGLRKIINYISKYTDQPRLSVNARLSFNAYDTSQWTKKQIKIYQELVRSNVN